MAEQLLDGADVVAGFEQMGCKAMTQRVTACTLDETGLRARPA